MTFPGSHNVGAGISVVSASANTLLTAGGAGDATQVVGATIDRTLFNYPLSMVLAFIATATLAANKKLTLGTIALFHGDAANMSDEASFAVVADTDVLVDSGAGGTISGQLTSNIDLAGCKRFIRAKFTPDLNAANTDTAKVVAVAVLGGKDTK
jgi:hypothetical protein